jgi:virulence-associated protein VapD
MHCANTGCFVIFMDLRKYSDCSPIRQLLIGFCNRDGGVYCGVRIESLSSRLLSLRDLSNSLSAINRSFDDVEAVKLEVRHYIILETVVKNCFP